MLRRIEPALFFALLMLSGCAAVGPTVVDLHDLPKLSGEMDERIVSVHGFVCVDVTDAFLTSMETCGDYTMGIYLPLDVDQSQFDELSRLGTGAEVVVVGTLMLPPPGAIRMQDGVLVGTALSVRQVIVQ